MSSYIPIASQTLASSAASVSFSSIPTTLDGKTLRDLVLVINATSTSATNTGVYMRVNGDTGSNYSVVGMNGNGSSATSNSETWTAFQLHYGTAFLDDNLWTSIVQIFDYAQTDKHKSVLDRGNNAAEGVNAHAQRWASTAAITSIVVLPISNQFASGSTFSLYGIEG